MRFGHQSRVYKKRCSLCGGFHDAVLTEEGQEFWLHGYTLPPCRIRSHHAVRRPEPMEVWEPDEMPE